MLAVLRCTDSALRVDTYTVPSLSLADSGVFPVSDGEIISAVAIDEYKIMVTIGKELYLIDCSLYITQHVVRTPFPPLSCAGLAYLNEAVVISPSMAVVVDERGNILQKWNVGDVFSCGSFTSVDSADRSIFFGSSEGEVALLCPEESKRWKVGSLLGAPLSNEPVVALQAGVSRLDVVYSAYILSYHYNGTQIDPVSTFSMQMVRAVSDQDVICASTNGRHCFIAMNDRCTRLIDIQRLDFHRTGRLDLQTGEAELSVFVQEKLFLFTSSCSVLQIGPDLSIERAVKLANSVAKYPLTPVISAGEYGHLLVSPGHKLILIQLCPLGSGLRLIACPSNSVDFLAVSLGLVGPSCALAVCDAGTRSFEINISSSGPICGQLFQLPSTIVSASLHPAGDRAVLLSPVISGARSGSSLFLLSLRPMSITGVIEIGFPPALYASVTHQCITFDPSGLFFAVALDTPDTPILSSILFIFDTVSGRELTRLGPIPAIYSIHWAEQFKLVVICNDSTVTVWSPSGPIIERMHYASDNMSQLWHQCPPNWSQK